MKHVFLRRKLSLTAAVMIYVFASPLFAQDTDRTLCADYPQFCMRPMGRVPGAPPGWGGVTGSDRIPHLVRGMTAESLFFLGNPAAPVHFLVFHSFTCSHCSGYYQIELTRFIEDYVQSGQAALKVGLLSFSMQPYSDNAVNAAFCAAEQGAFWEMQHELFVRGSREGVTEAFTPASIQNIARDLDLDVNRLWTCTESGQYGSLMERHERLAFDLGVTATPTVLMRTRSGDWKTVVRNYDNLAQLTLDANTTVR